MVKIIRGHHPLEGEKMNNTNTNLNLQIPTYEFKIEEDIFETFQIPTALYINNLAKIWQGYDKYPEMASYQTDGHNPKILDALVKEGVHKIIMNKQLYDQKYNSIILDTSIQNYLKICPDKSDLISWFITKKSENPYIGIFIKYSESGQISELDWLPIPIKKLKESEMTMDGTLRSFNIFHYNNEAYLVSFIFKKGIMYFEQYHKICESDLFYSEYDSFADIKMKELLSFLPNRSFIETVKAWDMFYTARYKYFMGSHPYNNILDPFIPEETDYIRMFLIWLNRLQEYIEKLEVLHNQGKTIVLTKEHNEMNGEYVSYNTTFNPEIRNEIISKKENFKLYAIANDWYILAKNK